MKRFSALVLREDTRLKPGVNEKTFEAKPREIPHPHSFLPSLPFAESSEWFVCGGRVYATQGWKLYVPLTVLNAAEIVERLVPLAQRYALHFKYIKSINLLRKLNAGIFGYTQIGKGFVIYLPEPKAPFIAALIRSLEEYRDQCPAVPCAVPFGNDLPLYYRYGSYQGRRIKVGGTEIDDDRQDASSAVPTGVVDLLAPYTTPICENVEVSSFLQRYPAYQAIAQQGKCGVFRALNLESDVFQEVILKVGYHRGQLEIDGSDGCSFLRRELAFYRELGLRELHHLTPRLVDALDLSRKVILVLEYIPGNNLLERKLQGMLSLEHLNHCWKILDDLHAAGVYLGDAKLANFLLTDNDEIRVIDFEAAGVIGQAPPPMRTFIIDPLPEDPCIVDRAHFLASVVFPYEDAAHSLSDRRVDLHAWMNQKPGTEIAAWAIDKLRCLFTSRGGFVKSQKSYVDRCSTTCGSGWG